MPATRELISGGVPRPVEPQVFDLLCFLIEQRSHVVSRDDLISAIWNGRIVSDAAIAARISAARSAVGDDGKSQRWIRTIPRKGFRFVGAIDADEEDDHHPASAGDASSDFSGSRSTDHQRIGFCRSADGTRIAYALSGQGYPLVKAGHWLTHVERDWNSPIWRPLLDAVNASFRVLRYDQRGNGLSDWELKELSLDVFVQDLEAVVDAAGLQRFALYGTSQGAPIAIAYASRHPDRVSHLVLHGGFEQGRLIRASPEEREQAEAILTLMRHGWGKSGSAFIEAFATLFIPDGDRGQIESLVELQRVSTTGENAVALRRAVDQFDVSHLLAQISVPTLVLHARGDNVQPLDQGRRLAAGIAGAEFALLESRNHVILPQEPAWPLFLEHLRRFLKQPSSLIPSEARTR